MDRAVTGTPRRRRTSRKQQQLINKDQEANELSYYSFMASGKLRPGKNEPFGNGFN
jgi:hypothetical protein